MNKITLAQREALDVVKDMIDKSNTDIPDYGTKILTLILGILNIDCRVEHTDIDINDITDITDFGSDKNNKNIPINPNDGNDRIHINIPDWIKNVPTPPFVPGDYQLERVWYNNEPEKIQTDAREDVRYATSISCNEDKNCITTTRNSNDCVTYTGDFTNIQTSLKEK